MEETQIWRKINMEKVRWRDDANNSHVACMQDIQSAYKIVMEMRAASHFSGQER
jgi:hypothetical protein